MLRPLLCLLLLLQGHAFAANPSTVAPAFTTALYGTAVGNNPAHALFLVNVLRRTEVPDADLQAFRNELLHGYVDQLTGAQAPALAPAPSPGAWASFKAALPGRPKAPVNNVAAVIARGQHSEGVLGDAFRADWQAAINHALAPRWNTGATLVPLFTLDMRDMQAIAPGIWSGPTIAGQARLMLSLRLANTSAVPVPIYRPDLILQGTLRFTCNWDRLPKTQSEMQANAVTLLQPATESDLLTCEAPPVPAYWREQLPALMAATGQSGLQTVLVPHDMDSTRRVYHVELAFSEASPQGIPWSQRLLAARHEPHRQWAPGQQALAPPESGSFASSPHKGWAAARESMGMFLGATVLALALFAGGRLMLRAGVPKGGVTAATLLVAGGLWAVAMARMGGGTGYSHPFYVGIALWSLYVGPMLIGVLGLYALHKLLDEEQQTWWEVVVTGWRHALNVSAPTSRGEFWGFLAHITWLWLLARICLVPLDRWIGFALLVPLITLMTRRMLSMTRQEWIEGLVMVVCGVLLVLA